MNSCFRRLLLTFMFVGMAGYAFTAADETTPSTVRTDNLGDALPPRALLRMGTERFRSPGGIADMVLADDDKILVTVGNYLTAWDAQTGKQLWRQDAGAIGGRMNSSYGIRSLDLMPDGIHVLTRGTQAQMLLWDVRTGVSKDTKITQLSPPGRQVISVDATSDGSRFAIGNAVGLTVQSRDGTTLYELMQPAAIRADPNNRDRLTFGGPFHYAIFSPDGKTLARQTNGAMKTIFLHDAATGDERLQIQCKSNAVRMDFSPNSAQLAVTERDTSVRLYDCDGGKLIWEYTLEVDRSIETYTSAIRFSPDGRRLAVAERQQRLVLLDATDGTLIGRFKNHGWNPWAMAFSSDSKTLYSSGWGGVVHRWDVETLKQVPVPDAVLGTSTVAASHNGKWIAHMDQNDTVHLIDQESGKEIRKWKSVHGGCESLAFSHDNLHLAGGGEVGESVHLSLWDIQSGQSVRHWIWPEGKDSHSGIEEIVFTRDGQYVAAASFRQDTAYLWEVATGEQIGKLKHNDVYGLDFNPDDKTLFTAGWDKKIRVWHVADGELSRTFSIPTDQFTGDSRMYTIKCDPSGEMIATNQLMSRIRFWNADDFKERGMVQLAGGSQHGSSGFSPDGLFFATGGSGTIQIWDPWSIGNDETDAELFQFKGHEHHVHDLQFAGDNRTLVSGAASTSLHWDLRPEISGKTLSEHADALMRSNGSEYYQAWWALVDAGDQSVALLRERLPKSRKLTNVGRMASGSDASERYRRRELLMKMAASNKQTLRLGVARRVVSVLSHIGSENSIALLKELASQDDELGDVAKQQLRFVDQGF